jgi:acetyl esterase
LTPPVTPRERVNSVVVHALTRLPRPVQRLLAGAPIRVDGLELDVTSQLLIRLDGWSGAPAVESLPPARAREQIVRAARTVAGRRIELPRVDPVEIPGPAGTIGARLYAPQSTASAREPRSTTAAGEPGRAAGGLLVYFHGGGQVFGDLDTHDPVCRFVASAAGVGVLAIDYRLAPEHPFPAAADDAVAALAFAFEHAERLGFDPRRIAVGGDSAGGNLAAVTALAAKAGEVPMPAFQLLFYPWVDCSRKRRSYELFGDGFLLTADEMDWFRDHYLPAVEDRARWRASPLLAPDHSGLPPAYVVTAGFDPLRDEGEEYARALQAAGVPTVLRRHDGLLHSFVNQTAVNRAARDAMLEACGALRLGLAGPATA